MNRISAASAHDVHLKLLLLATVLTISTACLVLYLGEFLPRYVTVPITLPTDTIENGRITTQHSVLTSRYDDGRVFVSAEYSRLYFDNPGKTDELVTTAEYFEHQLHQLGWVRSEEIYYCDGYLPEQQLLANQNQGQLLEFHQPDQPVFIGGHYFGDLVCLSILKDAHVPQPAQGLTITVLTARQSWLRLLSGQFDEINY